MDQDASDRLVHARLIDEARRYLSVVDAFRTEGCDPCWNPEREPDEPQPRRPDLGVIASRFPPFDT